MRVILGLDAPDAGTALIGGRPYRELHPPLCHVGSLLDASALQPGRSARNHLVWLACSQGLKASRSIRSSSRPAWPRWPGGSRRFSLGMRQRLGLPRRYSATRQSVFDEPVNGLDPEGIVWIRGYLRWLAAQGRAVLISSHLMTELEDTADHLVVVGRGRVIADTSVHDLLARASGDRVELRTSAREEAMRMLAGAGAQVRPTRADTVSVSDFPRTRSWRCWVATPFRFPRSPHTGPRWKRLTWNSLATWSSSAPNPCSGKRDDR